MIRHIALDCECHMAFHRLSSCIRHGVLGFMLKMHEIKIKMWSCRAEINCIE